MQGSCLYSGPRSWAHANSVMSLSGGGLPGTLTLSQVSRDLVTLPALHSLGPQGSSSLPSRYKAGPWSVLVEYLLDLREGLGAWTPGSEGGGAGPLPFGSSLEAPSFGGDCGVRLI